MNGKPKIKSGIILCHVFYNLIFSCFSYVNEQYSIALCFTLVAIVDLNKEHRTMRSDHSALCSCAYSIHDSLLAEWHAKTRLYRE